MLSIYLSKDITFMYSVGSQNISRFGGKNFIIYPLFKVRASCLGIAVHGNASGLDNLR